MKRGFEALQITDHVWWVGAIDWDIRDFHGYMTGRGTSWNAYLILGDEPILIDTVKRSSQDEMMARIASVIKPDSIRHIVSNHTEMDHSGCLPHVICAVRPKQLIASQMGAKSLPKHFDLGIEITPVEDGQTVLLGNTELTFVETRMLHWPDSMFTYFGDDQVLFSSDAFGMHLASNERFVDEVDREIAECESAKYFANILLPLSAQVLKTLGKVESLDLPVRVLASDHGPIWRADLGHIMGRYAKWAEQRPTRKAVVLYDSMWDSTKLMAKAIGEGLAEGGAHPTLMWARGNHRSDVATAILDAGALLVGSPTLNNGIFPAVADVMTYLKGLRPKNLIGATFGSYGWSGEAVKLLDQWLADMKVEPAADSIRVQWVPTEDDLAQCRQLGVTVAKKLDEMCDGE